MTRMTASPSTTTAMNGFDDPYDPSNVRKGKGKALQSSTPSERTPLLASSSTTPHNADSQHDNDASSHAAAAQRSLRSRLVLIFLVSLSVCIGVLLLIVLTAYSYVARVARMSPEELLDRGLVVRGPDRVDVLNVTDRGGLWLSVHGRVGLDVGAMVGLDRPDTRLLSSLSGALGRWGIRTIGHATLRLGLVTVSSGYATTRKAAKAAPLVTVVVAPLLELPLTAQRPAEGLSWLTSVAVPLLVYPTQDASAIAQFTRDAWAAGFLSVDVVVDNVLVRGGRANDAGWRHKLEAERSAIRTGVLIESEWTFSF